jgi:hypothetical protein
MSSDFDWETDCKSRFTTQEEEAIANERGVDPLLIDQLRSRNWIGWCYCDLWHDWGVAFPIADLAPIFHRFEQKSSEAFYLTCYG